MKAVDETVLDVLDVLVESGWPEAEVVHKTGRSRTLGWRPGGGVASLRQEEGWAVRAGDDRRSFFYAAAGSPDPEAPWPEGDGRGLRLPSPRPVPPWTVPSELDAPLAGESEAQGLFDALARELDTEMPGARLIQGLLEDGSSEQQIASSRELRAVVRQRTAALWVEAQGPRRGTSSVSLLFAEREARGFHPPALARRLADRLLVVDRGQAPNRDRGDFLLGPEVMVALLDATRPLWVGPGAPQRALPLVDRGGHIASRAVTLVDDGRLPGGVLEAPVDGEGQPTRDVTVVDRGVYRQPVLAWWQTTELAEGPGIRRAEARASGCCRRAGWRDLPEPGPTHLYMKPDRDISVGSLLADLPRGYYLLGVEGGVRLDLVSGRFAAPVSGFAIESGRATGSVTGAWLTGTVSALLTGILAVARDLTFLPRASSMIGAPSVLAKGLELRRKP